MQEIYKLSMLKLLEIIEMKYLLLNNYGWSSETGIE